MDVLSNLKYAKGSTKQRKRIGRGEGSGHGGTATKGMNGQKSRSGYNYRPWFEGGQMPLQRRVPKRGFTNIFKVAYQVVNLEVLQQLVDSKKIEDGKIDAVVLYKNGVISKAAHPYKILGSGALTAKLQVEANKFSASAKEKIESAGGTIKEINA
ncbi:MAG: 50S ribosomal protein L15 [Ignavibacteriae bacterium HGW-Ignavibacteriae-2]|jgi:large subunit ribosomal protein L15|nr:50S ribosomal protein L15 [Bacteroidota bacterium]PKL89055.1 MAG: 50S ribosomal protein L15 [Ignavibacteriae bacterium HGW-Ignavibacteriae-2]